MRQALCYSFPLAQYAQGGDLPDSYEYAGSIIPGAARLYDESYTNLTAKGFSLGSVTYPDGRLHLRLPPQRSTNHHL